MARLLDGTGAGTDGTIGHGMALTEAAFVDSVIVFILPLAILFGNSLIGQKTIWPWFYYASVYLLISLVAWQWQVHIALAESELASFARLTRPLGPLSVIYVGIPYFAAAAWADGHGFLSPVAETLVAISAGPAACLTAWIFVREWRSAIEVTGAQGG